MMRFKDRVDAGDQLADRLMAYKNNPDVVVVGLARGGVVIAHAIAQKLQVPFDAVIVRKVGSPFNPEYALGALAEDGSLFLEEDRMQKWGITGAQMQPIIDAELAELERRKKAYRGDKELINLQNKIVIVVDDGVATGSTLKAALKTVRAQHPAKIIVAVPIIPLDFAQQLLERGEADDIIYLTPFGFSGAIGAFYDHFAPVTDAQVMQLLT